MAIIEIKIYRMKSIPLVPLLINLFTVFSLPLFSQIYFTENKGQYDSHIQFVADIPDGKLFAEKNGFTFVLFDTKQKSHDHEHGLKNNDRKGHVYKAVFEGCNRAAVSGLGKASDFKVYYHTNRLKNAEIQSFHAIRYENIYPNIDLKLYSNDYMLKYDFIVKPGGKPNDIKVKILGADSVALNLRGGINIVTSVNTVSEKAPFAYQGRLKKQVACHYTLEENTFSFKVGNYDPSQQLVIDPELIFSTYSGSVSDNWGFTAAYDSKGNVYSVGVVDGYEFIETLGSFQEGFAGGYSFTRPPWDVAIIKYTPDGTDKLWASYLGGSGDEFPSSIICNSSNELIILGTTGSADFPMVNAYQSEFKGGQYISYNSFDFPEGCDLFITRISENGQRIVSSTYLGGSQNDGLNFRQSQSPYSHSGDGGMLYNYGDGSRGEVNVDEQNNVYIATNTFSSDFPASNTFSGIQDGVLAKFNPSLSGLTWAKFLGGSSYDALYSVAPGADGSVYTCGGTQSNDLNTSNDAYQEDFGGETDGFIAKFAADGTEEIVSYYGSGDYDQAFFVQTDTSRFVYTLGQTGDKSQFFRTEGRYGQANTGQFISKFSEDLQERVWSTTFGSGSGYPNIAPTAFLVDNCGRIYASGFGREFSEFDTRQKEIVIDRGSYSDTVTTDVQGYNYNAIQGTKGMDVSANAFQSETDGQDFYFIVLSPDAVQLEYATFFGELHDEEAYYFFDPLTQRWYFKGGCLSSGEDHVDGGTSRFDKKGNIYQAVCASCGACQSFPIYPGEDADPSAWSTTNNSSNCNNAVIRFKFDNPALVADFYWDNDSCHNEIVQFTNTSQTVSDKPIYRWTFGDGTSSDETEPEHVFPDEGRYRVVLTVTDSLSCNITDSIVRYLDIKQENIIIELDSLSVCSGDSVQIGPVAEFEPGTVFRWMPSDSISDPNVQNPKVWPSENTEYHLYVDNGSGCIKEYIQKVRSDNDWDPFDFVLIAESENDLICYGDEVTIKARSASDNLLFEWSNNAFFDFIFKSGIDDSTYTFSATEDRMIYVKAEHAFCESFAQTESIRIEVDEIEMALFADNSFVCIGGEAELSIENLSAAGTFEFNWSTENGTILNQTDDSRIINTLNYSPSTYIATAIDENGCEWTDSVVVGVDSLLLNAEVNHISCHGFNDGSINIRPEGFPPYQFEWSTGDTRNYIDQLGSGYYSIDITDGLGCENFGEYEIIDPDPLILDFSARNINCESACNGAISIDAFGGWEPYAYEFFTASDSVVGADSLCLGKYYIKLTDSNGCVITDSISILSDSIYPGIHAWADDSVLFYSQSTFIHAGNLQANDSLLYAWSPSTFLNNDSGSTRWTKPEYSIMYRVSAVDQWGCKSADSVFIKVLDVICDDPYIFVPTAFTPNDDNKNDYIQVKSQMIDSLHFIIYDRLGEKVFETEELEHRWSGIYKGQQLEPQVFVYYLEAVCIGGERFKQKGNITLIR